MFDLGSEVCQVSVSADGRRMTAITVADIQLWDLARAAAIRRFRLAGPPKPVPERPRFDGLDETAAK